MLKAVARWILRNDTEPKRKGRAPDFVSHEELKMLLEEHMKDITYEWNEWYEKFDKLHLRLARRAQRAAESQQELPLSRNGNGDHPAPSVLNYRRPWSV